MLGPVFKTNCDSAKDRNGTAVKVGDQVKVHSALYGWGKVKQGDIGVVKAIGVRERDNKIGLSLEFPSYDGWSADPLDLEKVKDEKTYLDLSPEERKDFLKRVAGKLFTDPAFYYQVKDRL